MPQRNLFASLATLAIIISLSNCNRDISPNEQLFYGVWKTSYGDTVSFAREDGKNILSYDYSMNPGMPAVSKNEFNYINKKLGIKNNFDPTHRFRPIQSFTWVQEGKVFMVQGIEWFNFLSSSSTYFTFTKIQ